MDFRNRRHERGSNWTDPEIVELLQLWSDEAVQVELESSLRNQRVFDRIANVLFEKGVYRSGDQCREKIKKMKLEYRRIKDNLKLRSWRFYDVMDRVLANRPSVTYSSMGGAVIAQQSPFQGPLPLPPLPPVSDGYLHLQGVPEEAAAGSFAPVTTGGFLFGQPTGPAADLLDVKCEEEDEEEDSGGGGGGGGGVEVVGLAVAPPPAPPPYEVSGEEPETEQHSGLEPEGGGFSDIHLSRSTPSAKPSGSGSGSVQDTSGPPRHPAAAATTGRQRKRRRAGKGGGSSAASFCGHRGGPGAGPVGTGGLDRALAGFLSWQRAAEERLLSLEEARQEREAQAEERRERQEERRGELERQHELRLLGVFAGALAAVKDGGATAAVGPAAAAGPAPTAPTQPPHTTPAPATATATSTLAQRLITSLIDTATPSSTALTSASSTSSSTSSSLSIISNAPSEPPPRPLPPAEDRLPTAVLPSAAPQVQESLLGAMRSPDSPGPSVYLSRRGNSVRQHQGILQEGFTQYYADRYHQQHNPHGFINMGTSENKLCFDLLHHRVSETSRHRFSITIIIIIIIIITTLTQPDMLHMDSSLLQYPDWKGHSFFRKALADFLSDYCGSKRPLDADHVLVMNGCGSLFSSIAAVICDPEEAILIPTPFYGIIAEDVYLYSSVKLFHVPLDCEASGNGTRPFHLTVEKLEEGLKRAKRQAGGPAPHSAAAAAPVDGEEFASSGATDESLDSLIGVLKQQIHSSDWLEKNTPPELRGGEDPAQLEVFTDLLQRLRRTVHSYSNTRSLLMVGQTLYPTLLLLLTLGPTAPTQPPHTTPAPATATATSTLAQRLITSLIDTATPSSTALTSASSTSSSTSSSLSIISNAPSEAPPTRTPRPLPPAEDHLPTAVLPSAAPQVQESLLGAMRSPDSPGPSVYLSRRGNSVRQHQGILQEGFTQYYADRYHQQHNPHLTQPDMLHMDSSLLQYPDWKGHSFFRKALADFLSDYCGSKRPLDADHVLVMNGCGSLFSSIAAVICDPEEAILIPTPFYGIIAEDVYLYSSVKLFHVPLDCEASGNGTRPFHLTVEKLEEGLKRAKRQGVVVRGVILVNPHNPLADIYTPQEMTGFLELAKRYELHAIVDEVYMLSVFQGTFQSVLGMDRTLRWRGPAGGLSYTENKDVMEALCQLAYLHGVPGSTQHQMTRLLQDR
ncbi:hypothetical protein CRUP_038304, partial [Coryphaenoides rupestris]